LKRLGENDHGPDATQGLRWASTGGGERGERFWTTLEVLRCSRS